MNTSIITCHNIQQTQVFNNSHDAYFNGTWNTIPGTTWNTIQHGDQVATMNDITDPINIVWGHYDGQITIATIVISK